MNQRNLVKQIGICLFAAAVPFLALAEAAQKPNVLFIAVDDLNDWIGCLDGAPKAITPNIDRLAARGVNFTQAYCAAPLCNPSRISLMTGVLPSRSGVYGNYQKMRDHMPDAVTFSQYFRQNGYSVKGGGKIYHHGRAPYDDVSWDEYFTLQKAELKKLAPNPTAKEIRAFAKKYGCVPNPGIVTPYPLDAGDDDMYDGRVARWAAGELSRKHDKPFFLACGIYKPHVKWAVPKKYFELYDMDQIVVPKVDPNDRDDLPQQGKFLSKYVYDPSGDCYFYNRDGLHQAVLEGGENQWKLAVWGYLACVSFADAQVGKVLDALENGPNADNTIVVLWGDHGWHLGEKLHWCKHTLWEEGTNTPLMFSALGKIGNGKKCNRPVSLIDIYPTLVELCGLPEKKGLDGQSIVPLLKNPEAKWDRPAITTYGENNHAIRSERYRYIRYHDGGEELYDHKNDPYEWENLAGNPEYNKIKKQHIAWLPKVNKPNKVATNLPKKAWLKK